MRGMTRILRRFVATTIAISISLLIFNFVLLAFLVFRENHQGSSPKVVVKQVSQSLDKQDENYHLDKHAAELLQRNHAWAMFVSNDGYVNWNYHLPNDVPRYYNLTDVAKFSRYYLKKYPVYVWKHGDGLVVIGYPKNSHWKYQLDSLTEWGRTLPRRLILLLLFNVALALLISIMIGTRLIKGIRPLVTGIHQLAKEEPVNLNAKGIFADLARSINSVSATLKKKTVALKERDEARSNWIAGISHDIRTPLSMILGYASEMENNTDLPMEQREEAGIMRRQGEKLRSLINDLNMVSMLEYEMQPLHLKSIRISVLARQVVAEFLNNGLDGRYEIELKLADEAIKINGDEKLLLRAIHNLVHNSVTHNPQGCKIILETHFSQDTSVYSLIVKDDGGGIPQEQLKKITALPYSSERKQTAKQGHGLGLPMVARIMQAHHGRLMLSSNRNQRGLKAVMEFPVVHS